MLLSSRKQTQPKCLPRPQTRAKEIWDSVGLRRTLIISTQTACLCLWPFSPSRPDPDALLSWLVSCSECIVTSLAVTESSADPLLLRSFLPDRAAHPSLLPAVPPSTPTWFPWTAFLPQGQNVRQKDFT